MSQHTPGPWNIDRSDLLFCVESESKQVIFRITDGCIPSSADASLIAAAPEMLTALQLVIGDDRLMNAMKRNQARAILDAIARTEGQ